MRQGVRLARLDVNVSFLRLRRCRPSVEDEIEMIRPVDAVIRPLDFARERALAGFTCADRHLERVDLDVAHEDVAEVIVARRQCAAARLPVGVNAPVECPFGDVRSVVADGIREAAVSQRRAVGDGRHFHLCDGDIVGMPASEPDGSPERMPCREGRRNVVFVARLDRHDGDGVIAGRVAVASLSQFVPVCVASIVARAKRRVVGIRLRIGSEVVGAESDHEIVRPAHGEIDRVRIHGLARGEVKDRRVVERHADGSRQEVRRCPFPFASRHTLDEHRSVRSGLHLDADLLGGRRELPLCIDVADAVVRPIELSRERFLENRIPVFAGVNRPRAKAPEDGGRDDAMDRAHYACTSRSPVKSHSLTATLIRVAVECCLRSFRVSEVLICTPEPPRISIWPAPACRTGI